MSLEIVVGPMFSGKSTYAITYARRMRSIGKQVLIVKPNIDIRYSNQSVLITHDKQEIPCLMWDVDTPLAPFGEIYLNVDCIVFEEAQFFKNLERTVITILNTHKKHILIVGLDGDASQKPFGEILQCIPWASKVSKRNALCSICRDGTIAPYTKRKNPENEIGQVCVGGADIYDAVCLNHL
jgi:thymidine kinase